MKKFAFALQPVLEHRKRIEDEKQQIVAQRKRATDEAEAELGRLNGEFRERAQSLTDSHDALTAEELRLHYAHLQFLDRTIIAQIQVVAERRVALERARIDLLEASKDRKVVEKLRSRRKEAHVAEEARIEQNELDDGNARRHARASVGGRP